jgi:hypothetical protein
MLEQSDYQGLAAPAGAAPRAASPAQGALRIWRGLTLGLRARAGVFFGVASGVLALEILLPPAVLSAARRPVDFFTFNPWLPELPRYLAAGDATWQRKLDFMPGLALFWFSADSPFGGTDWGFAVTVSDLARFTLMALLFGAYFALLAHCRDRSFVDRLDSQTGRRGGVAGVVAGALGFAPGGCSVVGCGAPVLPVAGLAFTGLASGTLALLADLSRIATALIFAAVALGVIYLAWVAGRK